MKPLTPQRTGFFDIFTELSATGAGSAPSYYDTEMLSLNINGQRPGPRPR